ncbi:hypothetical protein ACFL2V_19310 [Pseudomonadota bacterium]
MVKLGNDNKGIPDVFIYKDEALAATVEVGGYIFTNIEDIRSHKWVDGVLHIDGAKSSKVHEDQPSPYTIIEKKIKGARIYERCNAEKLILLLHSDVRSHEGELCFASIGPMIISPSCNHFSHNRDNIIEYLRNVIGSLGNNQWDEIWLTDYTHNVMPTNCEPMRLY